MKTVFTTGQVAKICKVAPRTVSKWFDSGRLKGYRIPGSADRRIPREHLIKFLKENGMPLGELEEEEWHKILTIGAEPLFLERLHASLTADLLYKHEEAESAFIAGLKTQEFHPDVFVIDTGIGRGEVLCMLTNLRRIPRYDRSMLIVLAAEDDAEHALLGIHGADEVFRKPFDVLLLAERIRSRMEERADR